MAQRTSPPFRADHVGSLLRPQKLLDARADFANGGIDADELRGIEDEAIRDAVQMQKLIERYQTEYYGTRPAPVVPDSRVR